MKKIQLFIIPCLLLFVGIANAQQQVSVNEAINAAVNFY